MTTVSFRDSETKMVSMLSICNDSTWAMEKLIYKFLHKSIDDVEWKNVMCVIN